MLPLGVERRTISYKDSKSKKRRISKVVTKSSFEGKEESQEGKTPTSSRKPKNSFHRMAKIVKLTRSVSDKGSQEEEEAVDHVTNITANSIPEVPEEHEEGSSSNDQSKRLSPSSSSSHLSPDKQRKKRPPPRPSAIVLKKESQGALDHPTLTLTPSPQSSVFPEVGEEEESHRIKSRQSPHRLTSRVRFRSPPQAASGGGNEETDEDFFTINYIQECVWGLWLCVANKGGHVMAFDFCMKPTKQKSQSGVSHTGVGSL
jgi:hypothetical protein